MSGRRIRLAWILLLGAFSACASISLLIPFAVREFIQGSTRSLNVNVQANEGTVGLLLGENESTALFAGEPADSLNPEGAILTNATDTALLLVSSPDDDHLLARAQVYGNTHVSVDRATSPRFSASTADHYLSLALNSGRLLLTLPQIEGETLVVDLNYPQGKSVIRKPGQYSILTSNTETQIAVLEGEAEVGVEEEEVLVSTDQRVILLGDGSYSGPLGAERNLIRNGDFGNDFDQWVVLSPNIEFPDQPTVELNIDDQEGEPSLRFRRLGIGHADSSIRQIVDEDVMDFDSLRLAISMRVNEQSLGVCGEQGSECPMMVRLEYEDVNGVDQTWLQGYYAQGTVGPSTPDVCITCPPPLNEHHSVSFGQLSFYESENLLEKLGQLGILPRRIKSITLIASGHTFDSEVVDVSLLAKE